MLTARAERNMESMPISFDTTPLNMLHMEIFVRFLRLFCLISQPPNMNLSHIFLVN